MSVIQIDRESNISIDVNIGTSQNPKSKKLTYKNFDPNAELSALQNAGLKIGACQTFPVQGVMLIEKYSISQE